jgi:hypothetical protein
MALVNHVKTKMKLSTVTDIVKYQLLVCCFTRNLKLSNNELDCLTLLALSGVQDLSEFCNVAVDNSIFKSPQTVRNFLSKAELNKLIIKEGTTKKAIKLNEALQIHTHGSILLDYQVLYVTEVQ